MGGRAPGERTETKAMEDARDLRGAEKDNKRDMDRTDQDRNNHYMFVSVADFQTRPNTPEPD